MHLNPSKINQTSLKLACSSQLLNDKWWNLIKRLYTEIVNIQSYVFKTDDDDSDDDNDSDADDD